MSKDLELKKDNQLAMVDDAELLMEVNVADLKPDYINIANPLSDVTTNQVIPLGAVYNSATKEVIAKKNESFEIVLFNYKKYMTENVAGKFSRKLDISDKEAIAIMGRKEYVITNEAKQEVKRQVQISFLGALVKDLENPVIIPALITFKGTYLQMGNNIISIMTRNAVLKKSPARLVFELKTVEKTNEQKQKWFVFEGGYKRETTATEFEKTSQLYRSLKTMEHEIEHIVEEDTQVKETLANVTPARVDDIDF